MITKLPLDGNNLLLFIFICRKTKYRSRQELIDTSSNTAYKFMGVESSMKVLTEKKFIVYDPKTEISALTENGKTFYEEYNQIGSEYIFEDNLDLAIISFLYHIDGFFPYQFFPACILRKAHSIHKGLLTDSHNALRGWMSTKSVNSNYYSITDSGCLLNGDGKKYFEDFLNKKNKENEKESLSFQHLKDSLEQIQQKLKDYPLDRKQKDWAFYFSIAAIIIAAISLLLQIFKS